MREHPPEPVPPADSDHHFRRMIENAQDMVYRYRFVPPPAGVEYIGGAAEAITGHSAQEFYADPHLASRSVHPDDLHHMINAMADPSAMPSVVTMRWVHPDGRIVYAEHRRSAVTDADGRVVAIEGIARDVTDRVEAQVRLQESREQMRGLAARLQSAREEERASLARELHDELGQTLTAIKLELARVMGLFAKEQLIPQTVDRFQSLAGLVEIGLTTVRRIATELRPPALDHLGLPTAIRWEAAMFRARTGLRCHVRGVKEQTALTTDQQTGVFRIFQEALTNVVRHADAGAVNVALSEGPRGFVLQIRDNGRGITAKELADPRAIGLLGMRERAALLGGELEITGSPGQGTTVTIRVATGSAPAPRTRQRATSRSKGRRR